MLVLETAVHRKFISSMFDFQFDERLFSRLSCSIGGKWFLAGLVAWGIGNFKPYCEMLRFLLFLFQRLWSNKCSRKVKVNLRHKSSFNVIFILQECTSMFSITWLGFSKQLHLYFFKTQILKQQLVQLSMIFKQILTRKWDAIN